MRSINNRALHDDNNNNNMRLKTYK